MRISKVLGLVLFAAVPLLAGCPQAPKVASAALQCTECVGNDVVANYVQPAPLPFYPQLCGKMLDDCGALCGKDLVAIINAVGTSQDHRVQATPAFQEAVQRRAAMLAHKP